MGLLQLFPLGRDFRLQAGEFLLGGNRLLRARLQTIQFLHLGLQPPPVLL